MKIVILGLLIVVLQGCGLMKAFDIQYAERVACDNASTTWAMDTQITATTLSTWNPREGWRTKRKGKSKICVMQYADIERWNKCTGYDYKCKLHAKKGSLSPY